MQLSRIKHLFGISTLLFSSLLFATEHYNQLSLDKAIAIALSNNVNKAISKQTVAIAEAQYQQALSARWPTLSLEMGIQRSDESPEFIFPSSSIPLGQLSGALSAALGGAPVPNQIAVPQQRVKLFDRNVAKASLEAMYPVYTGGKITSVIEQAGFAKSIANQQVRRTELEIVRDVKRYYYAAQLTRQMHEEADATTQLLKFASQLTKDLYENGSETVNKLDYLKTEMAVSYADSVTQNFATKHQQALSALRHAMGLDVTSIVSIHQPLQHIDVSKIALNPLVEKMHHFNPQMEIMSLAVNAADAKVTEAKSAYYPQVAITAKTTHINNSYNEGLINDTNRNSWNIGIGVKLAIFDGWLTKNRVSQAKLEKEKLMYQQKQLKQGAATMLKNLFLALDGASKQLKAAQASQKISDEYTDLSSRALQIGMAKPKDLIEAYILDAMNKGRLLKATHDQLLHIAEIEYLIGSEVAK